MYEGGSSGYSYQAQGGVGVGSSGTNETGGATDSQQTVPEPVKAGEGATPVVDEQSAREQATDATNNDNQTAISESAQ